MGLGCEYLKKTKKVKCLLGMSTIEHPDVGLHFLEKSGGAYITGIEVHSSP